MAYPTAQSELPLGVAILAVLIGIVGVLFLIGAIILLLIGAGAFGVHALAVFGTSFIAGLLLLIFAILLLVVAGGLWNQELWALVLSIIVVAILWIGDILGGGLISLSSLILFVLLVYLVLVRHHFS